MECKGTSRQESGKDAIRKRFPLQKTRWKKGVIHCTLYRHVCKMSLIKEQAYKHYLGFQNR